MNKIKVKKSASILNDKASSPTRDLYNRLIKDKAIDMRDNYKIVELSDGYVKVIPLDETKYFK